MKRFPKNEREPKRSAKWFGTRPRKRGWHEARGAAETDHCEHCGKTLWRTVGAYIAEPEKLGVKHINVRRYDGVTDHLVPERLILALCYSSQDPHDVQNLMCLCAKSHAIKTEADRHLCAGNKLKYLEILRTNNWPMDRIERALALYGF